MDFLFSFSRYLLKQYCLPNTQLERCTTRLNIRNAVVPNDPDTVGVEPRSKISMLFAGFLNASTKIPGTSESGAYHDEEGKAGGVMIVGRRCHDVIIVFFLQLFLVLGYLVPVPGWQAVRHACLV